MIRFNKILILLLFPFLIAACSRGEDSSVAPDAGNASWPVFRGDRNLSGTTNERLFANIELRWSFDTGESVVSSPAVGFGNVYIGSTDGVVYAVRLNDGSMIWQTDTGDDIEASPLLIGETLYIGNLSGNFFAMDARDGAILWQSKTGSDIMGSANRAGSPAGSEPLVVVGSYDTKMYCFDTLTGELQWTYETGNYINGAPGSDGEHVVFGGCDAILHIVSAADGSKTGEVEVGAYIAGSTALVDGRAYLGHYDGGVVCIDVGEQLVVWEYTDGGNAGEFFSSPAVGEDRVIIGSRDNYLHCIDRVTGKQLWKFRARDEIDSSPVIADGAVVVGASDGRVYMLDIENGQEIWSYEIGTRITGCPAITGGMIFIGAEDGRIYAFGERT